MIIYSQQNKQDLITQDFQSDQAVGKPIGNRKKLGVSRNWMRKGGTVQWEHKTTTKKHLRMAVFIIWTSKKDKKGKFEYQSNRELNRKSS